MRNPSPERDQDQVGQRPAILLGRGMALETWILVGFGLTDENDESDDQVAQLLKEPSSCDAGASFRFRRARP